MFQIHSPGSAVLYFHRSWSQQFHCLAADLCGWPGNPPLAVPTRNIHGTHSQCCSHRIFSSTCIFTVTNSIRFVAVSAIKSFPSHYISLQMVKKHKCALMAILASLFTLCANNRQWCHIGKEAELHSEQLGLYWSILDISLDNVRLESQLIPKVCFFAKKEYWLHKANCKNSAVTTDAYSLQFTIVEIAEKNRKHYHNRNNRQCRVVLSQLTDGFE